MIILGLDISTNLGWCVYDTKSPPSTMLTGAFHVGGGGLSNMEKCSKMRAGMVALMKDLIEKGLKPDYAVLEAPLSVIMAHTKKTNDMAGESVQSTMNPGAVMILNRLSGVVQTVVEGFRIPCSEVSPRTWQTLLKPFKGGTKDKAAQFCEMLKIPAKNEHARDAAGIAMWAAGHCQEIKMMEMGMNQ